MFSTQPLRRCMAFCPTHTAPLRRISYTTPLQLFRQNTLFPPSISTIPLSRYSTMSTSDSDSIDKKITINYNTNDADKDLKDIKKTKKFQKWIQNLNSSFGSDNIEKIEVEYIKRFSSGDVGFIVTNTSVKYQGKKVPGVVFMRGASCAILIILKCNGKKYTLMTYQPRVPVGVCCLEIPAGTVDEGNVSGTAIKEMEEETGLKVTKKDLKKLTPQPLYMSPGGMDEEMTLYVYEKEISEEKMKKLHNGQGGLQDHGEVIELRVMEYDTEKLSQEIRDLKSLMAFRLYDAQCQ